MKQTYAQEAKDAYLSLSLRDLSIDENSEYLSDVDDYIKQAMLDLVMFSPTNQSHLGEKFDIAFKIPTNKVNKFLENLFNGLGVKNVFVFESFTSNKKEINWREDVLNCHEAFILYRCTNGAKNSLYESIRNALAHGNIMYKDGYYIFYSVSDDKREYDSPITFFMRIRNTRTLKSFKKCLVSYKT